MSNIFNVLLKAKSEFQIAHILQKDGKYATHMILEELYKELDSAIDDIIEKYLGLGYKVESLGYEVNEIEDNITYIEELYKKVENAKSDFTDSFFIGDLEGIQSLLASCLYKLKFVK